VRSENVPELLVRSLVEQILVGFADEIA